MVAIAPNKSLLQIACAVRARAVCREMCGISCSGADQEKIEPGGANSINYQTDPGAQIYFFSRFLDVPLDRVLWACESHPSNQSLL